MLFVSAVLLMWASVEVQAAPSPVLGDGLEVRETPSAHRLKIIRDPLPTIWNPDKKGLLPVVANLLAPRFITTQRLDDGSADVKGISISLLGNLGHGASHQGAKRHRSRQDKRLVPGLVNMLKSAFQHDDGWNVYVAPAQNTEADNEWLVDMGFGTPSQSLKVVFDTGSPDTWVYSPDCCYHNNHNDFQPSESSTYTNRTVNASGKAQAAGSGQPGTTWQISYGGGSTTQGYIGIDTIAFPDPNLSLPKLPIALATAITGTSRAGRAMEGLVGMSNGAASQAAGSWVTPLEALARGKLLDKPYLTANFVKANRRTGLGGGGSYILGGLDTINQSGNVTWLDVTSSVYWGADYDDMLIGTTSIAPSSGIRMIMDTGSALINLPQSAAKQANALIQGAFYSSSAGFWLVPCKTGLPEYEATLAASQRNRQFTLVLGSQSFVVPPEDFVFYPNDPIDSSEEAPGTADMCIGAFQRGPDAFAVVGATFIKNHAVTFDVADGRNGQRRIGIANRTDILPLS